MLDLQDISVKYGSLVALRNLSFSVAKGTTCAIVGANGAGKSSLIKAICGLTPVASGRILFEDQDITNWSTERRVAAGIALSPEGRRLFPEMTVAENLRMGAYLRTDGAGIRADMERIYGIFPRLRERMTSQGRHLSGGEQQMCAIGRALMSQPRLLLLDEPSLGLAPALILDVAKAIRQIGAEGSTIVLVEQNARLALKLSQSAVVLETGDVVMSGDSTDIANDPHVTEAYLGMA